MSKKPSLKQLQDYLIRRIIALEGNIRQSALVDLYLGEEHRLRAEQWCAVMSDDVKTAVKFHNERIRCLEQALEILRTCPGCEQGDHKHGRG